MNANPASRPHAGALQCLERGGAVITANERAARALRRLHTAGQRSLGRLAWQSPTIHSWDGWLGDLWRQHLLRAADAPLLLSPYQERAVWKQIIGGDLGDPHSIAKLAASGWKLLSDYRAHGERHHSWRSAADGDAGSDAEDFRRWAEAFDRECRRQRWVSRSGLAGLLAASMEQGIVNAPGEIMLLGFDRITPAQRGLIEAAKAAGAGVAEAAAAPAAVAPQLILAQDRRDEIATCAWWARRQLESNPDARLAVLAQDIESSRGEIERNFRRILRPGSVGIESREAMPYEFSLGQPLAGVPVIRAGLLVLRWLAQPLSQAETSWLLLSGFLNAAGESLADMAALDAEMRRRGKLPPEAALEAFAACQPAAASEAARNFFARLRSLQRASEDIHQGRPRSIGQWIEFSQTVLRQMRWPGNRTPHSVEYQALDRWERVIADLGGLAFDGSRLDFSEFVTTIDLYTKEAIFAPESRDAAIQIMGAFEASGQHFDAVWFLGADDRQWPAASQPHPLLPQWLQRKASMPHADIDLDWQLNLAVTRRVGAGAAECVFSYARLEGDDDVRPSPLLREAFGEAITANSSDRMLRQLCVPAERAHRRRTVPFDETSAVPWPRHIDAGGSEILKRQSACPFQSFATRRLSAGDLDLAERGLSPRDRGNILHDVLEGLWSGKTPGDFRLSSRLDLFNAKAAGRLDAMLAHHIDRAFRKRSGNYKETAWAKEYHRVERARLHSLLSLWLDYEEARCDFTVVSSEEEQKLEVNGLRLKVRVDRVDRIDKPPGGHLILDYKTGNDSPKQWVGDRPEEPQLPLYAVHGRVEPLRGVLFAKIRAGEICFVGHAENATDTVTNRIDAKSDLAKKPLDETLRGEWSDALSNLADGFLYGVATVTPRRYPATCEHCHLHGLCRVAETAVAVDSAAEDGDGEAGDDQGAADE